MRSVAPLTLVLIRVALAAACSGCSSCGAARGCRCRPARPRPSGAGAAQQRRSRSSCSPGRRGDRGGLASILNATTPIWGVLVAHLFTADEKATPAKVAGVLLGFARRRGDDRRRFAAADRRRRPRPARLPRRDALLRARRRLGAALPGDGGAAGRGRDRPAHRRGIGHAAAGAAVRAALARRRAVARGLGRAGRARLVLHQPRLHPLFPAARLGRRDQRAAGHLPDPGDRDPARRAHPRRAARAAPFRRHGADRPGLAAIDGRLFSRRRPRPAA